MSVDRKEIAETVLHDLGSYKLCMVCGAIVDKSQPTCPDCYAYKFDDAPDHVYDAALDMAIHPTQAVSHLDLTINDED